MPCFKLAMDRFVLTDAQWAKMEPHCRGKKSDPGRSGADNRRFVEAVLWIARTGSPWRDLPATFGHWNTVFKRYRDWVKADVFKRLFDAASDQPDMEYAMVDATILKSLPRRRPGSTVTGKAQKGDCEPGHWPLPGRHNKQNPRPDRRAGQPCPLRAAARTAL
jgi:transposase